MKKMQIKEILSTKPAKNLGLFVASAFILLIVLGVYNYSYNLQSSTSAGINESNPIDTLLDFVATNTDSVLNLGNTEQASSTEAAEVAASVPAIVQSGDRAVITLAGGCFWCTEAFFQEAPGVISAVSGYAGGDASTATYKQVSKGTTAHREAVQVTYNPTQISTQQILDIYWGHIDPVDVGGQFSDRGFQYTTAIYYHTNEQRVVAEASKKALSESGLFQEPIAPRIIPYTTFFPAEEYHQDYYKKSSEHYERYKKASGRAGFIEDNWAKEAALEYLEAQEAAQ